MIELPSRVQETNGGEIIRVLDFFDIFLIFFLFVEKFRFFYNVISVSFCECLGFYFLGEKFPIFDGIKDKITFSFHRISGNP